MSHDRALLERIKFSPLGRLATLPLRLRSSLPPWWRQTVLTGAWILRSREWTNFSTQYSHEGVLIMATAGSCRRLGSGVLLRVGLGQLVPRWDEPSQRIVRTLEPWPASAVEVPAGTPWHLILQGDTPSPPGPLTLQLMGMGFTLADCCHPLPGDRIVGLRRKGQGVEVHAIDCLELASGEDADWVDLSWGEHSRGAVGRLHVTLYNRPGTLAEATGIFAGNRANIDELIHSHDLHLVEGTILDDAALDTARSAAQQAGVEEIMIVGGDDVSYGAPPRQDPQGFKTWKEVFIHEVRPQISDADRGVLGWVGRAARTAILIWVILQPEFGSFWIRVMEGGALWDWRLIVPLAVLTVYSMIRGWSQVSRISDQAIYAYFSPSDSSRPSASTPG